MNGAFLILSVVIGPGLIINAVFKDHWDRPRPRDVVEFGGMLQCTPAPLRGESGESFPCGHCSVGFLYRERLVAVEAPAARAAGRATTHRGASAAWQHSRDRHHTTSRGQ